MSELTYPARPAELQRPKAVTVIGWIWLVLAALSLFKTIANFIFFVVLKPAIPSLVALAPREDPWTRYLNPILEHYTYILGFQALLAAAVGISAYFLLRLRPWARVAIETTCWLGLVYIACFAAFWLFVMSRAAAARPSGRVPTSAGVVVFVALAAGLAVMIGMLRSRRTRAAFLPPLSSAAPRYH
jgi:hypothetical protein